MAETTLIVTGIHPETESVFVDLDPDELSKNRVKISSAENSINIAGCGKTSMETIVKIVNPKTFEPTASNEIGEIWIGGPTVAKGYWKKTEETQRTFNAFTTAGEGPFLRSGDLGFLYQEELFITGRIKDLIIIRGANYYPSDIEYTVQKSHVALRENANAAFSVALNNQESLVVVQELERTAMRNTNFEEIISTIREAVSEEHEIDIHAILLIKTGSIPMTSSGKIQRRQTRYEFLNNQLQVVASWEKENLETKTEVEKQTPTEDILQNWLISWVMKNQQFKREEIDLDTPITRYGIDSLAAVTLESEINTQFGFQWHVSSFMMNPTINELVKEGMEVYKEEMK